MAIAMVIGLSTPALAQRTSEADARVETIAGPGYCPEKGTLDPTAMEVRALAVSRDLGEPESAGSIFVAVGPSDDGTIARIEPSGRSSVIRTGVASRFLAPDRAGGVLISDGTQVVRADPLGLSTVAGSQASRGRSPVRGGDGGDPRKATFDHVAAIATDEEGNVFVADQIASMPGRVRVRYVGTQSERTFFAGTAAPVTVAEGTIGTVYDELGDRPAQESRQANRAIALAVSGNRMYLAISVAPRGGSARGGSSKVVLANLGGAPMVAHGLTLEGGRVAVVAGAGPWGFNGDGGPGVEATFTSIQGMAADPAGNLYLADTDNERVRRLGPDGNVGTIAGYGPVDVGGFNGNDRPATRARLNGPADVEVGPLGDLYIADRFNHQVRTIDPAGIIRAAQGNGVTRSWVCQSKGVSPEPADLPAPAPPVAVTSDAIGNVYIASRTVVRRIDPRGVISPVVGGTGNSAPCRRGSCSGLTSDHGVAALTSLKTVSAIAVHPDGGLYVLDAGVGRVFLANVGDRLLRASGVVVTPGSLVSVVGNGGSEATGDGGQAREAQLSSEAEGLDVDREGNLYVADGSRVRRVGRDGTITTVAGSSTPIRPEDRVNRSRCCVVASGLAVNDDGVLYISDADTGRVWARNLGERTAIIHGLPLTPGTIRAVAGLPPPSDQTELVPPKGFEGDGGLAQDAPVGTPLALALGNDGDLFVASWVGQPNLVLDTSVRRIDSSGRISTQVGGGGVGFNGDGLKAQLTTLGVPTDLALDRCGNILIADPGNNRVRRVQRDASCRTAPEPSSSSGTAGWLKPYLALLSFASAVVWLFVVRRP